MRCIELFQCYYWTFHFLADQISHQHSRDRALQKNGRLLIKGARKNVTQFTNNSNTLIDFSYLFVNMFQCKFFIKMYPQMLSSWCCWTVELWNRRGGSYTLVIFREEITSWPYFDGSGSKDIFHLLAQGPTLSRSFFSFCEDNRKHWSIICKRLYIIVSRLSDNSLIY